VRRLPSVVVLLVVVAASLLGAQQAAPLPTRPESLKFAVIGDTGTGEPPQFDVGSRMAEARRTFPFDLVIMLGDNIYGSQTPQDFVTKFQRPYAPLLTAGVLFHATLGNHDAPANRFYPGFNMGGLRYYTYFRKNVQFFVLDSNAMDPQQLAWLDNALKESVSPWKICYFHHPLYSNAKRHGSEFELRVVLEPLFVRYGVNVVYSGHDHIYERIKPQKGITYFVNGSSGQLRAGDTRPSATTAAYFDRDQVFSLVEVDGDDLFFQAITRTGRTVDSGVIHRQTALQTR
jgi:predicted MPP superfamily phosphohydrolase